MKPAVRYLHVWLFAVCFIAAAGVQLFGAPLAIEGLTEGRNIEHSDTRSIYQAFVGDSYQNSVYTAYLRPPLMGDTSLSMTTEWNRLQTIKAGGKTITSLVWGQLRKELRRGAKKYFEQDRELSIVPQGLVTSVSHFGRNSNGNKIVPKFKFGSDYVKPTLHIKKPFHMNLESDISYHTGDRILEASLSRKLSSELELSIKQTNYFEQERRQDWLFGIAYEF